MGETEKMHMTCLNIYVPTSETMGNQRASIIEAGKLYRSAVHMFIETISCKELHGIQALLTKQGPWEIRFCATNNRLTPVSILAQDYTAMTAVAIPRRPTRGSRLQVRVLWPVVLRQR